MLNVYEHVYVEITLEASCMRQYVNCIYFLYMYIFLERSTCARCKIYVETGIDFCCFILPYKAQYFYSFLCNCSDLWRRHWSVEFKFCFIYQWAGLGLTHTNHKTMSMVCHTHAYKQMIFLLFNPWVYTDSGHLRTGSLNTWHG